MTKAKTPDLETAFADVTTTTTALRFAHGDLAAANQDVRAAEHAIREDARRAVVDGREHRPDGALDRAFERSAAAKARVAELNQEATERMEALTAAARQAGAGGDVAETLRGLIDTGTQRLALAISEIGAAREGLEHVATLAAWIGRGDTDAPLRLGRGVAKLAGTDAFPSPNGEPIPWTTVDRALMGYCEKVRTLVDAALAPKPPAATGHGENYWNTEMLAWNIAAGGSYGDSLGDIRSLYLDRGPRRDEAARDLAAVERANRTGDQRTWARV